MVWFACAAAAAAVGLLLSEVAHWRASAGCPQTIDGKLPCAVIVLGYPSRSDGGLHPVQRWRTEIAARSLHAAGGGSTLLFTGAVTRDGPLSEAEAMARYAVEELGVPSASVQIETDSTNTWTNLERSLPLAEPFERIAIVSDPLHAARARRYAALQRPDLEPRIVRPPDFRPFERWWLKIPTAIHEGRKSFRDFRNRR